MLPDIGASGTDQGAVRHDCRNVQRPSEVRWTRVNRPAGRIGSKVAARISAGPSSSEAAKSGCHPRARDSGASARSTATAPATVGGEVVHEQDVSARPHHAAEFGKQGLRGFGTTEATNMEMAMSKLAVGSPVASASSSSSASTLSSPCSATRSRAMPEHVRGQVDAGDAACPRHNRASASPVPTPTSSTRRPGSALILLTVRLARRAAKCRRRQCRKTMPACDRRHARHLRQVCSRGPLTVVGAGKAMSRP